MMSQLLANSSNIGQYIGGALAAALILVTLYLLTMWGYFATRRRMGQLKFAVEIVFAGVALLVAIGIRWGVMASFALTVEGGAADIYEVIFRTITTLAFDGELPTDSANMLSRALVAGSSIYAAGIVMSIITARASYEAYSWVRMRVMNLKRYDIYIFTDANENTLLLANSIQEEYERRKAVARANNQPTRRAFILFTGDDLPSIDRSNPIHCAIMERGYGYWSINRASREKEKSLVSRFRLYHDNRTGLPKSLHIFAFGLSQNDNLQGHEAANSGTLFEEVERMSREMCRKNREFQAVMRRTLVEENLEDKNLEDENLADEKVKQKDFTPSRYLCMTHLYVLTHNDVDYCFYEEQFERIIEQQISLAYQTATGKKLRFDALPKQVQAFKKEISLCLQLHVENEALITAHDLTKQHLAEYENNQVEGLGNQLLESCAPHEIEVVPEEGEGQPDPSDLIYKRGHRAMMLGFGKTGQCALQALYHDTSFVEPIEGGFGASLFVADCFDSDISAFSGVYAGDHPSFFVSTDLSGKAGLPSAARWGLPPMVLRSADVLDKDKKPLIATKDRAAFATEMAYPTVCLHQTPCLSKEFGDVLDDILYDYDSVVVSLGTDERNITMTNSLLSRLKRNKSRIVRPMVIYVNIRDEQNRDRIDWHECDQAQMVFRNEEDAVIGYSVRVCFFGGAEQIFSYAAMVDETGMAEYNRMYGLASGDSAQMEGRKVIDVLGEVYRYSTYHPQRIEGKESPIKVPQIFDYIRTLSVGEPMSYIGHLASDTSWFSLSLFKRQSNFAADNFKQFYRLYLERFDGTRADYDRYYVLSAIEHQRWNRFHLGSGWLYGKCPKNEREHNKLHNCLVPFSLIDDSVKAYDVVNVILASRLLEL